MKNDFMKLFQESLGFLEDHPAFACRGFSPDKNLIPYHNRAFDTAVVEFCKNGWCLYMAPPYITIRPDHERFEEFLGRIGEKALSKGLQVGVRGDEESLEIDYMNFYGYPWELDHYEVLSETGYRRFLVSSPYSDKSRWESWHDYKIDTYGKNYEESVIALASKVREKYGHFNGDNILPKWIEEHNYSIFKKIQEECDGDIMGQFNHPLRKNSITVTDAEKNEIWWQLHAIPNGICEDGDNETYLDVSKYLDEGRFRELVKELEANQASSS
jgi:hypothetical protein